MTPTSDLARRAHQRLGIAAALGLAITVAVAVWAWWSVSVVVPALRTAVAASQRPVTRVIEPAVWDIRLWQPFTDVPIQAEVAPPPLKLYSILKRGGNFIAALSAGDDAPMVYASSGDVVQGVTIRAIDATGVDLRSARGDQRLDLRP